MEGPFVHLRTYQAYSMAEALGAVKRELGADAVILGTRTFRRRGFLWFGGRTIVEVTAAAAEHVAPVRGDQGGRGSRPELSDGNRSSGGSPPERMFSAADAAVRARAAYGHRRGSGASATGDANGHATGGGDPGSIEADRLRTKRLAQAMLEQYERRAPDPGHDHATGGTHSPSPDVFMPESRAGETGTAHGQGAKPPAPPGGVVRGYAVNAPGSGAADRGDAAPGAEACPEADVSRLDRELAAIRSMVGEVLRGQARGGNAARVHPPQLFDWYTRLIGQEMSEELADRILRDVRSALDDRAMEDPQAVRKAIRERIAAFLPCAGAGGLERPREGRSGRPFTMVLVGPTGVGKTTTVAKLAATFKLRFAQRVGLITCDTYRIGAVEQLRTYAGIIGVELRVVLTPKDMTEAMAEMRGLDTIIVDTAGRSQNDQQRIAELRTMVTAADPDEVHLVLSSTAGERVLLREAEAFGCIGIDRVLLTKLDEAVGFGMLISVVHRLGKQISFMSAGQEVPQHIEAGDPMRLADLLLREEVPA